MVKLFLLLLFAVLQSSRCSKLEKFSFKKILKPLCQPFEACAISHYGTNHICECPELQKCTKDPLFDANMNLRQYQFCEPLQLPKCKRGQVMLEVENYHHLFHCVCPEYLEVVSLSWDPELDKSRYVCSKHRICEDGDVCRRIITYRQPRHLTKLRKLCDCPDDFRCGNPVVLTNQSVEIEEYTCSGASAEGLE